MNFAYRPRFIFLTCLMVLSCWNAAEANPPTRVSAQAPRLGREFTLRARQQITLPREGLRIKFVSVNEDSRCPTDVQCVWAGNAAVRLDVSIRGKGSKTLTLNTNNRSPSVDENLYRSYKLKLVDLRPYPRSNRKIAPGDYVVTLLVSKN